MLKQRIKGIKLEAGSSGSYQVCGWGKSGRVCMISSMENTLCNFFFFILHFVLFLLACAAWGVVPPWSGPSAVLGMAQGNQGRLAHLKINPLLWQRSRVGSRRRKVNTGAMLEKVSQFFSSLGEKSLENMWVRYKKILPLLTRRGRRSWFCTM